MKKVKYLFLALYLFNVLNLYSSENLNNNIEGIQIGDNSRVSGKGSVSTSKNGIAIGKGAVSTGGLETKESIEAKLKENEEKINEIENLKKIQKEKLDGLLKLKIKEKEVIDAGIRVEELLKAKEKAKNIYDEKAREYNEKLKRSKIEISEAKKKIEELNSRLLATANIKNFDIHNEENLETAANEFKIEVEKDTKLNLLVDFYKEYIKSHYQALGELRKKESQYIKNSIYGFAGEYSKKYNNDEENIIGPYTSLSSSNDIMLGYKYTDYYKRLDFYTKVDSNSYDIPNTDPILIIDHIGRIVNKEEYDKTIGNIPKYKEFFKDYMEKCNDMFLTEETKKYAINQMNAKLDYQKYCYEIAYYQFEYERTNDKTWLDKKNVSLKNALEIYNKFKNDGEFRTSLYDKKEHYSQKWKKENIDDVKEKNKLTVEKLTTNLELVLGINRDLILKKERELEKLEKERDEAKKTYDNLNPSERDLVLSAEYKKIKAELDKINDELIKGDERLKALKEALTLYDLKNLGKDNIAFGTDTLTVGDNSIAFGKGSKTIGENSLSIGVDNLSNGINNTLIGQKGLIKGNETQVIGNSNLIYGDNNLVFGNNNKIGTNLENRTFNILIGQNIDASNVNNSIVLGNASVAVENALSIGSNENLRKIVNVKEGLISETSNEAITGKQLNKLKMEFEKKLGEINMSVSNTRTLDNIDIKELIEKLSDGANVENPKNMLVTDTLLKKELEKKVDKKYLIDHYYNKEEINEKFKEIVEKSLDENTQEYLKENISNLNSSIASVIAMNNIPQVSGDKYVSLGFGYGINAKKSSFAVGISGTIPNRMFVYKLSLASTIKGKLSAGLGFNLSLGQINSNDSKFKKFEKVLKYLEDKNKYLDKKIAEIKNINYDIFTIIGYESDGYLLTAKQKEKLSSLIEFLKNKEIILVGYADLDGQDKYNLNLGIKRANEIKDFLLAYNIKVKQVKSSGFNTIINDVNDKFNNRRVEILVK